MSIQVVNSDVVLQVRQAFPFSVVSHRLSGPDNMRTDHFGLFRDDNSECVGNAVTALYKPHTTEDVCAMVQAASDAFPGDGNIVRCHWDAGHFVSVQPSPEYRREIFHRAYGGEGTHHMIRGGDGAALMRDTIWPRLIIRAGYDGRAFRAELGFFRDLCNNLGIIRSAGLGVTANIRHSNLLWDKLASLRETMQTLAGRWDNVRDVAQQMQNREVDLARFLAEVYPIREENQTQRVRTNAEQRVRAIIARIQRERRALGLPLGSLDRATGWEAYNAVQGYVQHDQRRRGQVSSTQRALMALEDQAVERALELAIAG